MPRYFAFLRAVNVGGRTVRMEDLRRHFESFGFREVETFIASGNVVFETRSKDARRLEKRIEEGLREALGFEVATFLRTEDELAALADRQPFSQKELDAGVALNVAFLKETLDEESTGKLMKLRTEIDDFSVRGREVFWLCRKRQGESAFSNTVFEKAVGRRATFRGLNTVRRMAAKYLSHNS
ncbi:MAG TPA: DUF1697 domain-containing protein [Pyrinomonadaceae bacterium]|nr:DUF1697 domain-containing protein [Pyrinomonadaceae bacterium]